MQREISEAIVKALRLRLVDEPRATTAGGQGTRDTEAYEWYLQGGTGGTGARRRTFRERFDFSIELYRKTRLLARLCRARGLARDVGLAWLGSFTSGGNTLERSTTFKRLRLNPALHLAHLYLGTAQEQCSRFGEALAAYEAALALAGRGAPILAATARCMARIGRQREAADLLNDLRSKQGGSTSRQ